MSKIRYHSETIAKLLRKRKIATMEELKHALGTDVDLTVFRKLKVVSARTSYSHRGRYYTLDEIAEFDQLGLWSFESVRFSRYGNLLATAEALVKDSAAGLYVGELEQLIHVNVKDALRKLVRDDRLRRERLGGRYLYCGSDLRSSKRQLGQRRAVIERENWLSQPLSDELQPDELKAAVVLFFSLHDEKQRRLYAGLESLKWGHGGDRKVSSLLGVDVGTIARGRRELLEVDALSEGVRRRGGGRKSVEKKRPK